MTNQPQSLRIQVFVCLPGVSSVAVIAQETAAEPKQVTASDILAAQRFGESLSIAEWLGPLAPVADGAIHTRFSETC